MYIIFGTVIVLVIILFGSSIFSMIKSYTSTPNPSLKIGNIWFISLLIINLTIITFIYTFYYYKSTEIGKMGGPGNKGNTGLPGNDCVFTIPNSINYADYNRM